MSLVSMRSMSKCLLRYATRYSYSTVAAADSRESTDDLDAIKGIDARTGEPRLGRNFNYKMELTTLARRLDHELDHLPSLQKALTHRSANWRCSPQEHNGRLAVLGKAVLMYYVQEYVYTKYPNMDAKGLMDICLELTHSSTLSDLTNQLGITELLLTNVKPTDGQYQNMLGKSFNAVIGAVHVDQGPLASHKLFNSFVIPILKSSDINDFFKLHKPAFTLNAILKREGKPKPEARLLKETGRLSHFPTYVIGIYSGDQFLGEGSGTSLRRAKNEAMACAIRKHYTKELKHVELPSNKDEQRIKDSITH